MVMRPSAVFLLLAFLSLSCSHVTDPKDTHKLYIHFQDENNKPIENAGLHFYVDFNRLPGKRAAFLKPELPCEIPLSMLSAYFKTIPIRLTHQPASCLHCQKQFIGTDGFFR